MPWPINLGQKVQVVDGVLQLSSSMDAARAKKLLDKIDASLRDENGTVVRGELQVTRRQDGKWQLELASQVSEGSGAANAGLLIEQLAKLSPLQPDKKNALVHCVNELAPGEFAAMDRCTSI